MRSETVIAEHMNSEQITALFLRILYRMEVLSFDHIDKATDILQARLFAKRNLL